MSLSDIELNVSYRSDMGNIVDMFYIPCLERSVVYKRAVGYFTSGGLAVAARGLSTFIKGSGKMFLVVNPYLTDEDCKAIEQGYEARDDVIARSLLRFFDPSANEIIKNRLSCLAWLIANNRLEIKIALPRLDERRILQPGIYHEKMGVFEDSLGNKIAFSGSSNETIGGLVNNFESIDVFWSWNDPQNRVAIKAANFDALWSNCTPTLEVISFPQAAFQRLLEIKPESPPEIDPESVKTYRVAKKTEHVEARPYQNEAIDNWLKNGCHGIFDMATGTGKTKTALFSVNLAARSNPKMLIIVVAPYKHLVEQWADECAKANYKYIICNSDFPDWPQKITNFRIGFAGGSLSIAFLITTYETFTSSRLQEVINNFSCTKFLIADEVHHLGVQSRRISLENFSLRLGLSATPVRTYDEEGTQWLFENIGPIVYSLKLSDAIPEYLCPYNYYIHDVYFTHEEQEDYQEVMSEISKACARGASLSEEDADSNYYLGSLLRKRQELIGGASNKLQIISSLVGDIKKRSGPSAIKYSLFYASSNMFELLQHELSRIHGLKISKFTFEENREQRKLILENFESGNIHAIIAKKCLDEGMDIPATRTAFIIASSSNPMEFIQRRGRVLRKFPNKDNAVIHDFFVLPPSDVSVNEWDRRLVERELKRAIEFASTARNSVECTKQLMEIQKKYNLLHL